MDANHSSKVLVARSPIQGLGLFAGQLLPKGEIILPIDDSRIVNLDNPLRPDRGEFEFHCDFLADDTVVLMKYPERHINHSCDPNAFIRTRQATRCVFALRDIHPGDEITLDYSINGFGDSTWQCRCGTARCRKRVHADFFKLPFELQVEYLPILDSWFVRAYQSQVNDLIRKILNLNPADVIDSSSRL